MGTALSDLASRTLARNFRRAQWRTLFLIMFCYLFFYTGRQNFGFAARGMQEEMALSATALGFFNAALLAGYGAGHAQDWTTPFRPQNTMAKTNPGA